MVKKSTKNYAIANDLSCLRNSLLFRPITNKIYDRSAVASLFFPLIIIILEICAHITLKHEIDLLYVTIFGSFTFIFVITHVYVVSRIAYKYLYSKKSTTIYDVIYTFSYGLTYVPIITLLNYFGSLIAGMFMILHSFLVSVYYFMSIKKNAKIDFEKYSFLLFIVVFFYSMTILYALTFISVDLSQYLYKKIK